LTINWAKIDREWFAINNYVRKADTKTNYWLNLSDARIGYCRQLTIDNFNIIIYGNENIETDLYNSL
jgi:hypothetical protein